MFSGLFAFLGALVGWLRDLWQAKQREKQDHQVQHEKRVQESEQIIAAGDADRLSARLDDDLRWLQNNRPIDRSGSGGAKD